MFLKGGDVMDRFFAFLTLRSLDRQTRWLMLGLVGLKLLLHAAVSTHWEFQRDAFLYLAQAGHPAWGYFSTPPLTAWILALVTGIFGDGVFVVRLIPALVSCMTLVIVIQMVQRLGGGRLAMLLAGISFLLSPAFLRTGTLIQPVVFDLFFWTLAGYALIRLIQTGGTRYWYILAVILALAWYAKYSIGVLILAILPGLLVSRRRSLLFSHHPWLASLVGLLIILPNLAWQWSYHWPVIHHMQELQTTQLVHVRLVEFLGMQLAMNAHAVVIWLAGIVALFVEWPNGRLRPLGWITVFVFVIIIQLQGKFYYTLGVYPLLMAVGGVALEFLLHRWHPRWGRLLLGLLILIGLPILPFGAPVLAPPKMAAYSDFWRTRGLQGLLRWEDGNLYQLPQDHADMIGWQAMAEMTLDAYASLSADEQARAILYGDNYGQAGALRYYGLKRGYAEPLCFNDQFLFWAPETLSADIIVELSDPGDDPPPHYDHVKLVATYENPLSRNHGARVYLCRGPQKALVEYYLNIIHWRKETFGH